MVPMIHAKNKNYQAKIFRGKEGLRALEADWRAMQENLPGMRFIHYYGWYKSRLDNTEPDPESIVFILASEADQPIAIFPLQQVVIRRFGLMLRTWQIYWPNDMGICDFIFATTDANRHILKWVIALLNERKEFAWDLWRLQDTLVDSYALFSLKSARIPLSLSILHHYSKYIRCDADYETVMARLSGHFRRNLRRQTKKIHELGAVEYRFISDSQQLEEAFNHFLQAEAASWKGDSGTGSAIQLYQDKVSFYRDLMREFSIYNACWINLTIVNGRCIASQFCLTIADTLYLLKIGYSEEHRAIGPGNVLLNELIQRCCANDKIQKISFITGADWNDNWVPETLNVYESYMFNHTFRGITGYILETAKNYGRRLKHNMQQLRERTARHSTSNG